MTDGLSAITIGSFKDSVKSIEVAGFVLTDLTHPPNEVLRWHAHERASLVFYLKGSVIQQFKAKTLECGPRSLLIKPPAETHFDRYGPSASRKLAVEVSPERLKSLHPFSKAFNPVSCITNGPVPRLALRVYKELIDGDGASPLAIEGLLLETVAELSRYQVKDLGRRPPRHLEQAREILHAHFSESLSLSTVAAAVGTHPVHLARQFRKFYGSGVGDYLRKLRIEYASRLLSTSSTPLFRIASDAGFSDHAHFCRTFKQLIGMTPTQYRAMFRSR